MQVYASCFLSSKPAVHALAYSTSVVSIVAVGASRIVKVEVVDLWRRSSTFLALVKRASSRGVDYKMGFLAHFLKFLKTVNFPLKSPQNP
jgi:hypothetical protein